ncbi:MAG: hypothetical protein CR984_01560 [Proteobacteria bacterium]|nr:MAG: hypothetical protein CR984_01560 [Pseudomonadota bacterium]PIE67076.1 MAG: hypothetical protein CSA23_05890 [Deltaproteobacteria bacterium]
MNDSDDSTRFTIRDQDSPPDSVYMSDVENLRLEKLGSRLTLITILIPCLLAVVLAVAYLDIKKRVTRTQTSGSVGVQKLSRDMEARFSNLSLKHTKLEQAFEAFNTKMDTAAASLHVNLKKAISKIDRIDEAKLDRTAAQTVTAKADEAMNAAVELKKNLASLSGAFDNFDDELSSQILLMAQAMKKDQSRLERMEKTLQGIETEKLSKDAMNLALGLERLAIQEMVKDRLREIDKKMAGLIKKINALETRIDALSKRQTKAVPPVTIPRPVIQLPPPEPDQTVSDAPIVEHTIE